MQTKIKTLGFATLLISALIFFGFRKARPEEGMFPMSEISRLDLKKAGLRLNQEDIFNPGGISLADALVRVGGCTGSFVSDQGLIITNHHCAFGAVQASSSVENDYITDGFLAPRREDEIQAKGITCKITQSYLDVSSEVLEAAKSESDPARRLQVIAQAIKTIESRENAGNPGLSCEISEMFAGRNYVLFRYQIIRDVRLVYVPPRTIGEFGGESDNWEWPRHTGDFSFLRAYVAPDGSPAAYHEKNVPFKPKKHLKVNPKGAQEGDFIFVLGYPGRTFRNQPGRFIQYQEKYQLPYIADLYEDQIRVMKELGAQDKVLEIRVADRIKSLANVTKNYRGKLQGFKELGISTQKLNDDTELRKFIESDPELNQTYGQLMPEMDKIFNELDKMAPQSLWFSQIYNSAEILSAASLLIDAGEKMKSLSGEEKDKARGQYQARLRTYLTEMDAAVDNRLWARMITDAQKLPAGLRIQAVDELFKSANTSEKIMDKLNDWRRRSVLIRPSEVYRLVGMPVDSLKRLKDPVLKFVFAIKAQTDLLRPANLERQGKLTQLMASYIDVKMKKSQADFIPDANATLRLTYGYVKGYSTQDAVYYQPLTTLAGMVEKSTQGKDYGIHPKVLELYNSKLFGRFKHSGMNDVPLAILYNTDTSGGNSGSPVMDADGALIGVNFDRAYSATINDYAWNDKYSRSIGVDIRFVLWVTQYVSGADFLLKEMGV